MSYINVFQRHEKKYILSQDVFIHLQERLLEYMKIDQYGLHTICNIYYDTDSYDLIRNSIEKPVYKEKLRLRSYGIPNKEDMTFLEIKKKYKGVVYKRRVGLKLKEAVGLVNGSFRPNEASQIVKEVEYFIQFHQPKPKVFIAYDRIAMFGIEDKEVRITFDANIRSRQQDLELDIGDYGELLCEEGTVLMEIKIGGAIPIWLSAILTELEIYPSSFSKYGNVYKKNIIYKGEFANV